jgi:hypothetical protein
MKTAKKNLIPMIQVCYKKEILHLNAWKKLLKLGKKT